MKTTANIISKKDFHFWDAGGTITLYDYDPGTLFVQMQREKETILHRVSIEVWNDQSMQNRILEDMYRKLVEFGQKNIMSYNHNVTAQEYMKGEKEKMMNSSEAAHNYFQQFQQFQQLNKPQDFSFPSTIPPLRSPQKGDVFDDYYAPQSKCIEDKKEAMCTDNSGTKIKEEEKCLCSKHLW